MAWPGDSLINTKLHYCRGWGWRTPFQGEGGPFSSAKVARGYFLLLGFFPCEFFLFLVASLIRIAAVTVCFLISLLIPVNSSYFNLRSLPFVPGILLSIFPHGTKGGEKRASREQLSVWRVSVVTLNWWSPFLSHAHRKVWFSYYDLFFHFYKWQQDGQKQNSKKIMNL